MNCSGYPYMPCSEMSRPGAPLPRVTRRPYVFLISPERGVAGDEDAGEHDDDAERLVAELAERARVDEAALADGVELRQRRQREEAARERAPDAAQAVRRQRADRVVELLVDRVHADRDDDAGDQADDRRRPTGRRSPTGAVIATSAPIMPLPAMPMSIVFVIRYVVMTRAEHAGARPRAASRARPRRSGRRARSASSPG